MTSGDKKRADAFQRWCSRRLSKTSWMERETDDWVLAVTGCGLVLRRSLTENKLKSSFHAKGWRRKWLIEGKVEGKRRSGRRAETCFCEITKWTRQDVITLSQMAFD